MPKEIYKILGQERPDSTDEDVLYTVPKNRSFIGKIIIFNHSGSTALVSVAIVPDGGAASPPVTVPKNYILEDFVIDPKRAASGGELKGITMNEFDEIRVETGTPDEVGFHVFGVELEP
tara:strand:+ start:406 stop:762 length:357 start_codon:yes stop_codon:yes gene_type:complete